MPFSGEKLRTARLIRNKSVSDLAKDLEISRQAVSQFENNEISPKEDNLFKISKMLKFPVSFFLQDYEDNIDIKNTFFRSLTSSRTLDLFTCEEKTTMVIRYYNVLLKYVEMPKLNLPKLNIENKSIESIAAELRDFWKLADKPILNMVNLLENNGIIVSSLYNDNKSIDAFTQIHSIKNEIRYCVVFNEKKKSMVRRNFDAAHELGHIILHKHLQKVKDMEKDEFRDIEKEANKFAAAFLLPKSSFSKDLVVADDLMAYINLKMKWRVSIAAMVMRAKAIGAINNDQYTRMFKSMSYRGWRSNEPLDTEIEFAKPVIFNTAIKLLLEQGGFTVNDLMLEFQKAGLQMNSNEIEELLCLNMGILNLNDTRKNVVLKMPVKST